MEEFYSQIIPTEIPIEMMGLLLYVMSDISVTNSHKSQSTDQLNRLLNNRISDDLNISDFYNNSFSIYYHPSRTRMFYFFIYYYFLILILFCFVFFYFVFILFILFLFIFIYSIFYFIIINLICFLFLLLLL